MANPATPVRNERDRQKSSSLRLLQENIRPRISSGNSSGTRNDEEPPSESSSVSVPLELARPTVREDTSSSTTSLEAEVDPSVLQLEHVLSIDESKFPDLVFALGHTSDTKKPILVVTQRRPSYHPPFGYTSRVHIAIQQDCTYQVHILMRKLEGGTVKNEGDVHRLLERFSSASLYKFCPGIDWTHYQEHYLKVIRFHLKSARCTEAPFYRVDSVNCQLWFELPSNARLADKALAEVLCSACKRLVSNLNWQLHRTKKESPARKIKRQAVSSRARLTYMSPCSQLKRKQHASMERGMNKCKLARYEATEVTLAEEQHTQMSSVMDAIDQVATDELQCIFEEGEAHGVGGKLREIWTTDKREQKEQFQKDQEKNGKYFGLS